jgi:hypothetical protein
MTYGEVPASCLKEALSLFAYGEAVAAQRAPTGHAAEA